MVARALWVACALALAASSARPARGDEMGKPRHSGPGFLTWVGFEKTEGRPRVFVRLSSPPAGTLAQARAGDELVVSLPGYKLDNRNDGRALDTRYFGTDVVRVVAQPKRGGLELRVRFKRGATEARLSTGQAPDGETLVNLDF